MYSDFSSALHEEFSHDFFNSFCLSPVVFADPFSFFLLSFDSTSSYHKYHHQYSCLCQTPPLHHHNKTAAVITRAAFPLPHVHICAIFTLKLHRCHPRPTSAPSFPMVFVLTLLRTPSPPLSHFVHILGI